MWVVERVVSTRVSSLIYAGWLPQDRTFGVGSWPLSKIERHTLWDNGIAHSPIAGHSKTLADNPNGFAWTVGGQSVRTASDQHQPASSRAIATLALATHRAFPVCIKACPAGMEAVPVSDLDRQPERGQRRDPTQAAQPGSPRR